MKDYLLSEIKNHDWHENWDISDDITKGHIEYEFLREVQRDLTYRDIKPRNMIELPYKQEIKFSGERSEWQIVWRDDFIQRMRFADFPTEPEADKFLQELKNGKV